MHPAQSTCKEVRYSCPRAAEAHSRTWCCAEGFRPSLQLSNSIKRRLEMTPTAAKQTGGDKTAIRPFHVNIPEAELTELRRRINPTKWPERETVTDASQGVQLATIQALARYWATEYDWRACEARLNAVPQFITEIDGLDIHF